jgi:Fic family protein
MKWNWEEPEWPKFSYDPDAIADQEKKFLLGMGSALGILKTIDEEEYKHFVVEILSVEGQESSKIEGELLDRDSLQSSIKKHFGLPTTRKRSGEREARMAQLLCKVYETFDLPLTHEMLFEWHAILFKGLDRITDNGKYRSHEEPMQIVSSRYGPQKVYFEAPPSRQILSEMSKYTDWYNLQDSKSILGKAAVAHVYFESIHPFEDGNGRIGRLLAEKKLFQGVGKPVLIALSKTFENHKKDYYSGLEKCNRTLEVGAWVEFFADKVLEAQHESMKLLSFVVEKAKMFARFSGKINQRQEKALLRLFAEGPSGFKGGLSAENYISITKATRATATRDLTDLVEKGALLKSGELRHTRYRLNLNEL